jgi:hypothetical protein
MRRKCCNIFLKAALSGRHTQTEIGLRRRDRTRANMTCQLDSELLNRRPDLRVWQQRRARAIRPRHRRVSLLGSVENEGAIRSEPIKQKAPAEAGAFD